MRIILAVVLGIVVASVSSSVIVSLKGPVFAWEMAGLAMVIITAILGGIVGGLSAAVCALTRLATVLKGFVGSGLGLAVGFWVLVNSTASDPNAPEGLAFWVVAMVVIAGGLSGLVGGLLAKTSNTLKPRV